MAALGIFFSATSEALWFYFWFTLVAYYVCLNKYLQNGYVSGFSVGFITLCEFLWTFSGRTESSRKLSSILIHPRHVNPKYTQRQEYEYTNTTLRLRKTYRASLEGFCFCYRCKRVRPLEKLRRALTRKLPGISRKLETRTREGV